MADLTAAGVTVLDSWTEGNPSGKRMTAKKLSLVLAGAGSGAASNKIPASVLGFGTIEDASHFTKSDNAAVVPAMPNAAGNELLLGGGVSGATASYTGTFTGIVKGQTPPWNT